MDEPTIPFGEPELWRVSAFRRAMDSSRNDSARYNALSPSLMADLQRFEHVGAGAEVLEVLAACLRHAQDVAVHLDRDGHVLPLTVFPRERLFHTPLPLESLYSTRFDTVQLLQVERALLLAPGQLPAEMAAPSLLCHPLGPLLWHLALHGPRYELLPELAGPAVYRVAPDLEVPVALGGALGAAVVRLRQEAVSLRALAAWPGFDRERAIRLLNGLYLQAGLIVSRTHPAAGGDSWFSTLSNW
ncbi:hypothetical protein [Methylibium sp.]|uniref:hypothetical protein n=1 Tax=Methylibium sp. TaxID=2067992 RepID=UPI00286C61B3|nr:hypothetical protein [Methylibium sp.]